MKICIIVIAIMSWDRDHKGRGTNLPGRAIFPQLMNVSQNFMSQENTHHFEDVLPPNDHLVFSMEKLITSKKSYQLDYPVNGDSGNIEK